MLLKSCTLLLISLIYSAEAATDKIVCYYASWAGYRTGDGAFKPENINADLCTHVLYAFLGVSSVGDIEILDSWNEIDLGGLSKVNALKQINPNLKTLISIGGASAGAGFLSHIVASDSLRANLIASSIQFLQTYDFDGLDVDWIFPQSYDRDNFALFLKEISAAFASRGFILSVSASASPTYYSQIDQISGYVDMINLLTYDFNTPSEGATGLNSPMWFINSSVADWLTQGAQAEKLTISVPFYGHSFSLSDANKHEIGDAATVGISGTYTQEPGSLGFNEICQFYSGWTTVWTDPGLVPYKYSGNNWISYDDERSAGLKAKFAKDQGLGGVAVWSVDTDDFHGLCRSKYSLLQAIKDNLSD